MKKFLSLLLVAVLVSAMFAIPVSAEYFWSEDEYELVTDGNWQPYFSWGYVFEIDSVNSTSGACTAIFDNATDYAAKGPGKWTTQILLAPVAGEEDVYEVIAAHKTTGKNAQANLDDGTIDFEDGKIVLSVHDSGTRPDKDAEGNLVFPNWEDRAASWGLMNTLRAKLTLDGNTLTVEDKPTPVISGWGADVDVMTDGYTGVGEITGYEGNNAKIYGFSNNLLIKAEYNFTVAIEETKFDAITLYALDYASGCVMLPEAVKFVVGDNSYDAVITPNAGGIATITAELDEAVTASEIKVEVVMGASPYAFAIFNMFTEITVNEVEDEPVVPSEVSNVALNKEYEISGIGNRDSYYGNVTDGVVPVGLSSNKEAEWFGFYHNGNYPTNAPDKVGYFIIDLKDEYTLTAIRAHLINKVDWGVVVPDAVKAYVSLDGEAFEEVGSFETDSTDGVEYWTDIEVACNAKYVKIEFELGGTFAFVSEIEVMGGMPGAAGDQEPEDPNVEEQMKELLGEAPENAKLDFVIDAPETYKAGDDITVTVTVENITAENGIHVIEFNLYYDNEKLLITNDLDETDYNALLCIDELPKGWENLSNVANDWTEETEEGTVVNPLNDGKINVIALTDKTAKSAAVKDDGVLVFTFTFKALEDAKGDIGLVIPHAEAEGAFNTDAGADQYAANGDYAVIADSTASDSDVSDPDVSDPDVSDPDVSDPDVSDPDVSDPDDDTKPGDASSMIIFAIIALIAIAGSAVVIKTRK